MVKKYFGRNDEVNYFQVPNPTDFEAVTIPLLHVYLKACSVELKKPFGEMINF